MLIWVIAVVGCGIGLMVGIDVLMNRLGIKPVDPSSKAGGFHDVIVKANKWGTERRNKR